MDNLKPREKSDVNKECLGLIGQSPGGNPQGYKKGLDLIQQNTGTRRLPVFCQRSGPNQQNKEIHWMKIFLEPRRCSDYTVPVSRRIVINLYSISFLLCLILKCIKIPHRKCLADLFYLQNNQNACSFIHFIVIHVSIYNKNGMFLFTTKFYFRI